MKYLAPLLLSTLLLLPSCGDDEPTTPPPPASPGPLATLLGAPPQVADELRLTFALGLKRAIDDQAHMMTSFWWYRIVLMRSYVKGWKTSPSHYLNQHLDNIWLEK